MSPSINKLLEFGIINIDKPSGPTSFTVSDFVRKKLKLRKTSHFGTLDPKVTGVLPIALNRACKLTGYFLGEDKEYVGIARFHESIEKNKIEEVIRKKFLGTIIQKPPVRSRVKRQDRPRTIRAFEILEQDSENPKDFLFRAEVQGGTYIRKLIDDLGKELGIGAHMLELRRTRAGIFKEDSIVNLYDFEKAVEEHEKGNSKPLEKMIIPAEIVKEVYPEVKIESKRLNQIFTGKPIHKEDLISKKKFEKGEIVSVFSEDKFVGMYEIIDGKEIYAKAKFVMQPLKGLI
ncbi:MAG: RNA-guided pseudouridylation complex pseudouridine synthase subunit Cbf5 [Nanoarchaeota archaeon]|nr:RNA-guided pseudouridylation complex pseudouridine synthase subunit Cbf5 [Nanoarchaeota archaeon]